MKKNEEELRKRAAESKIRIDTIKNKSKFNEIYPRLAVLARSRPEDKYALVIYSFRFRVDRLVTTSQTDIASILWYAFFPNK